MPQTPDEESYVPRRMHRKARHVGRTILLSLLMVVVTVVGVGGTYAAKFLGALDSATVVEKSKVLPSYEGQPTKDPGDESRNILLLGADKSEDGSVPDLTATGTDQRSDSMMLVHIPADRSGIYVMSIMRDTYVNIPGVGYSKINAALSYGGVPLLSKTIESMLDVKIDNVAMLDFDGFKGLTEAIGGVTVDNPQDWCTDSGTLYCFKKGKVTIKGNQALRWVRERHAFVNGDYQRVLNQQQFMKAVFKKLLSPEVLANPVKLGNVIREVMPYVTMDSELDDVPLLVGLGLQLKDLRASDVHTFTLPNNGTGTAGSASIVINSPEWNAKVGAAMKNDTMSELYATIPSEFKGD